MKKWEYKSVIITDRELYEGSSLTDILTDQGKQGWQLTGYEQDTGRGTRFLLIRQYIAPKTKR